MYIKLSEIIQMAEIITVWITFYEVNIPFTHNCGILILVLLSVTRNLPRRHL